MQPCEEGHIFIEFARYSPGMVIYLLIPGINGYIISATDKRGRLSRSMFQNFVSDDTVHNLYLAAILFQMLNGFQEGKHVSLQPPKIFYGSLSSCQRLHKALGPPKYIDTLLVLNTGHNYA